MIEIGLLIIASKFAIFSSILNFTNKRLSKNVFTNMKVEL